jgi:hypothetical protein
MSPLRCDRTDRGMECWYFKCNNYAFDINAIMKYGLLMFSPSFYSVQNLGVLVYWTGMFIFALFAQNIQNRICRIGLFEMVGWMVVKVWIVPI